MSDHTPHDRRELPEPTRSRWQPLRAGLVDLFYYDIEEFHFHDGRLLLRGNNGTGKSKVLALTLPFLLDGELSPNRVEPDGDRNKRMEWNLLLGGKHPNDERTGYTWLEFGRLDADGTPRYRTIGCGLKAVKGRGIARHWFFSTTLRIGADLPLMSATRVPLTRERLREAIGGTGRVLDTATEYRRTIDEELFGLGQERYEALVGLLISLRQPQLSKKPDEKLLSKALTDALPPLDPALVGELAEAFRGLDDERHALDALAEASRAAEGFLGHYRRYARIAAKRQAGRLRTVHSRYEHLGRDLGEAEAEHTAAEQRLGETEDRLEELKDARVRLTAALEALQRSPEMDAANELNAARRHSETLTRVAGELATARAAAQRSADGRSRRAQDAAAAAEGDAGRLAEAREEAELCARAAGLDHQPVAAELDADHPPYPQARRAGERVVERRRQAVAGLVELLTAVENAERWAREAQAEATRRAEDLEAARESSTEAAAAVSESADRLSAAYRHWQQQTVELRLPDPEAVWAALDQWTDTLEGPNPAALAADREQRERAAEFTRQDAGLDAEQRSAAAEQAAVEEEIARLESGGHDRPPQRHTADPQARADRPGAPLWRAVDFADLVGPAERACLEAALEASGLLDAWITPEGVLLDPVTEDVFALPDRPAPGPNLTALLTVAVDRADPAAAALDDTTVRAVLASVALGEDPDHASWVTVDGRWRMGALAGAWTKAEARYLGEGARESSRRARLLELSEQAEHLTGRLERLSGLRADLAGRAAALAAEHRAQPLDAEQGLRDAHTRRTHEEQLAHRLAGLLADAVQQAADRRQGADRARQEAAEYAADTGLPADRDQLDLVREALAGYRAALAALFPAAAARHRSAEDARAALADAEEAAERLAEAAEAAEQARHEGDAAAERHRVFAETVGADVAELFHRIEQAEAAMRTRDTQEKQTSGERDAALTARARADGRRGEIRGWIEETAADRGQAITALRAFTATGLLATALPALEPPDLEQEWAPTPAVALARAVDQALDDVSEEDRPWELAQERVAREQKLLTDALSRHGHSVGMTLREGVMVVDVLFQGRSHDVPGLASSLREEVEQRGRLLSAKERELLENHLVGEVAGALQELIAGAEEQVGAMNADLELRPTSTGMKLRLQWLPAKDAPPGLEQIRQRLLRQAVDAWRPADRAQVGEFLQARIAADREEHEGDSWTDQLTRALDYRAWHRFVIQRHQDGQWRPATGPASGGERVLAASVPLFAAASSHYSSGSPDAPRLIALDEAFAGVDDDSRAKCLGLLAAFDLDVVMTSEREWACYPTVPGIGIAQLSRREGIDAVLVTPWRWDGRERVRRPRPVPYVPAASARARDDAGDEAGGEQQAALFEGA